MSYLADMEDLQDAVGKWGDVTFPKSDVASVLKHLKTETVEFFEATDAQDFDKADIEAADIVMLLFHYCHKRNKSLERLVKEKFSVNRNRTWETEPGDKGYCKHVEPKD